MCALTRVLLHFCVLSSHNVLLHVCSMYTGKVCALLRSLSVVHLCVLFCVCCLAWLHPGIAWRGFTQEQALYTFECEFMCLTYVCSRMRSHMYAPMCTRTLCTVLRAGHICVVHLFVFV